jgi:hypothetical protein
LLGAAAEAGVGLLMKRSEVRALADSFLREATARLKALPFAEIKAWPEFPAYPNVSLNVPTELSAYSFNVGKHTEPDGRIRVEIHRYRSWFLGIGLETAEGFIINPNGETTPLSQDDILGNPH